MKGVAQAFAPIVIALAGASLLLAFAGGYPLLPFFETSSAVAAKAMSNFGSFPFVTNGLVHSFEYHPLPIWLQALGIHFFGVNEFAVRMPMIVCSIFMLLSAYVIGSRHFGADVGFWWVACLLSCTFLLPLLKTAEIGFIGAYFAFLAVYRVSLGAYRSRKTSSFLLAGIFAGLAGLSGGLQFLIFIYAIILLYWVLDRFRSLTNLSDFLMFITLSLVMVLGYPIFEIITFNDISFSSWIQTQFQDISFSIETIKSVPFILFVGGFPAVLFIFGAGGIHTRDNVEQRHIKRWLLYVFYFSIFLIFVSNYFFFTLAISGTFLSAYCMEKFIHRHLVWNRSFTHFVMLIGGMLATCMFLLGVVGGFGNEVKENLGIILPNMEMPGWYMFPGIGVGLVVVVSCFFLYKKNLQAGLSILLLGTIACNTVFVSSVGVQLANAHTGPIANFCKANPAANIIGITLDNNLIQFYQEKKYVKATAFYTIVPLSMAASFAKVSPWYKELFRDGEYIFFERMK